MPHNISPPASIVTARHGRREFLRCGLTGFTSLSLPGLLKFRAEAGLPTTRERTALIVVWLHGGASHLETYDPKPNAPAEYRGPFSPIATKVPGLQICELLPRHAAMADKFTILRSMAHTGVCHNHAQQEMFSGRAVRDFRLVPEHPDCLSIINYLRRNPQRTIPNYVGIGKMPYSGAAYLGLPYEPFAVSGNPNSPDFSVPNVGLSNEGQKERLSTRLTLRQQFDRMRATVDLDDNMRAMDTFEQQAWNMLTSPAARRAFDLTQEDASVRDRYGRTSWGQHRLMARRLVESGVDLVTVTLLGKEAGPAGSWDDHAVNHHVFNQMKERAPNFDQAVTALINDIFDRGLDRRVLVVVTGEFGRTPKISYAAGQPGRDHWPAATSMLFSGAGVAPGQLIGATDKHGEQVVERRVRTGDFVATLYHHLGVDPTGISFNDLTGRPIPIFAEGAPIPELSG